MSNTLAADPLMTVKDAAANELVQRKMDLDALRKRLADPATKQEKLRETCEGFEAIFLQKMWEQMRKTVPKEGFLHSKDEEMYQSLFDVELCKKMAGAGGIGLADMLYEQLSQQLENTGRTTSPSGYRVPLTIPPAEHLGVFKPEEANPDAKQKADAKDRKMTAEELYTPLPDQSAPLPHPEDAALEEASAGPAGPSPLEQALSDLKKDLGQLPDTEKGVAAAAWAEQRAAMTGLAPEKPGEMTVVVANSPQAPLPPSDAALPASGAAAKNASPELALNDPRDPRQTERAEAAPRRQGQEETRAPEAKEEKEAAAKKAVDPALLSWQGNGPVSATPKPVSVFGRNKTRVKNKNAEENAVSPAARGLAPQESLWPLDGSVISRFGWEDDQATGKRRWNSGINIAAPASSPVRAVLAGKVVYSGEREGQGSTVVLEHKGGYRSYYSNLEPTQLKIGDKVQHGADFARIAAQPSSPPDGENTATLYFEIKRGEMALNPESAIRRMETAS